MCAREKRRQTHQITWWFTYKMTVFKSPVRGQITYSNCFYPIHVVKYMYWCPVWGGLATKTFLSSNSSSNLYNFFFWVSLTFSTLKLKPLRFSYLWNHILCFLCSCLCASRWSPNTLTVVMETVPRSIANIRIQCGCVGERELLWVHWEYQLSHVCP